MRLTVDHESIVPPFEQVRLQLAAMIDDGRLPGGTRLQTVRQLAGELGLAVNTVARTYRELEQAGLVETRGRNGTFVAAGHRGAEQQLQQLAEEYATRARQLGVSSHAALAQVSAALGVLHLDGDAPPQRPCDDGRP